MRASLEQRRVSRHAPGGVGVPAPAPSGTGATVGGGFRVGLSPLLGRRPVRLFVIVSANCVMASHWSARAPFGHPSLRRGIRRGSFEQATHEHRHSRSVLLVETCHGYHRRASALCTRDVYTHHAQRPPAQDRQRGGMRKLSDLGGHSSGPTGPHPGGMRWHRAAGISPIHGRGSRADCLYARTISQENIPPVNPNHRRTEAEPETASHKRGAARYDKHSSLCRCLRR
jgi:hypothetical protein